MRAAVGLRRARATRVLAAIGHHEVPTYVAASISSVRAARMSFALDVTEVVQVEPRVRVRSPFASSGRAVGEVSELDALPEVLDERRGGDTLARSTQVGSPSTSISTAAAHHAQW